MTDLTPIIAARDNINSFQMRKMGSFLKQGWIFTGWLEKLIILFCMGFTAWVGGKMLINLF